MIFSNHRDHRGHRERQRENECNNHTFPFSVLSVSSVVNLNNVTL